MNDRVRVPEGDTWTPSLVYMVGRLDRGVRRELTRRLASWDLSLPELTALSVLQRRPGLSNAQLARRSLITPQSMSEVVASLERRGLVERTVDPDHARIRRADLTAEGRCLLAAVTPDVDALQDEMLGDLSPEQRELVLSTLFGAMIRLSGLEREG